MKFTMKGGIRINVINGGDEIQVEVIDTGIGIKKEDQDRLFRIFGFIEQQDKTMNKNGVGLGLVIAK